MCVMRSMLLKASENSWLRERAPRYRFIRRSVERFLPGEKLERRTCGGQSPGGAPHHTLLTHLGENVAERAEAENVTNALPASARSDSIRRATVGNFGKAYAARPRSRRRILLRESRNAAPAFAGDRPAEPYGSTWSTALTSTRRSELYRRARKAFPNVGVCVQAYLYRTEKDLRSLISLGATVRLVKGAYSEPSEIAYPKKSDVDESYFRLAQLLLSSEARAAGVRAALATHDTKLIARIVRMGRVARISEKPD